MLEIDSVTAGYDGSTVLRDVSVSIDEGEFVLICGPNGSGKTTLLHLCNGLLTPMAGTVSVDGFDVESNPVRTRTTVGLMFQHPRDQFVATTIEDDVAFGPSNLGLDREEIVDRVERALRIVGLSGRGDERIEAISGGERSRVALAGAIAMDPRYLLLDEPLIGLDLPAYERIVDHLQSINRSGTTIVLATHDLRDVIGYADRIIAIEDGMIAIDDDPVSALDQLEGKGVRIPYGYSPD